MPKKNEKKSVEKVVKKEQDNKVQVHFGNVEKIKIVLLEAIAKNTAEMLKLLKDIKE